MIIIGQILKERYSMTVQGISNERVPAFGYYNLDCMEGMKHFPDNYFDLAIVDPPYFSGPERRGHYGHSESLIGVNRLYEKMNKWQVPEGLFGTNAMVQVTFRIARLPIVACKELLEYSVICGMECFRGEACLKDGFSREIKPETKRGFIRRRNRLFYMNGCCRNMQNQVLKFWIRMSGVRVV